MRRSASARVSRSSALPVPLNSSKMMSSILLSVSTRAVAITVSEPPPSLGGTARAAPNRHLGRASAVAGRAADIVRPAPCPGALGRVAGRTMSGGLDANALAKPKGLFGAARAVPPKDGGGSLTVIATALVETESRMDDIIFEEFKGTGNAELRLTRDLADRRIYPAVDIAASGTRREELLADAKTVEAKQKLRRALVGLPPEQAMQSLLQQMKRAATNAALLNAL